jgi:hypothetical protein
VASLIIQIVLLGFVFICIGRIIGKLIKLIKMLGWEGMFQFVFKQTGLTDFHLEAIHRKMSSWRNNEKYDKEAHYREWAEKNFPPVGEDKDAEEDKDR